MNLLKHHGVGWCHVHKGVDGYDDANEKMMTEGDHEQGVDVPHSHHHDQGQSWWCWCHSQDDDCWWQLLYLPSKKLKFVSFLVGYGGLTACLSFP